MSIMNTYTGKKFDPLQMKPEDVDLVDIAHALSLLCRGGGHIDRFYTVALHSINCLLQWFVGNGLSAGQRNHYLSVQHHHDAAGR